MKLKKLNFYEAQVQVERQLWKAGSALGLVKVIAWYVSTLTEAETTNVFLYAAQEAAWTSSVVKSYVLLDDARSMTIPKLIELAATIEPRTQAPFLSAAARVHLTAETTKLSQSPELNNLRNNEEAHTHPEFSTFRIYDAKALAKPGLQNLYSGCLNIMDGIAQARGERLRDRVDFEGRIKEDMLKLFVKK